MRVRSTIVFIATLASSCSAPPAPVEERAADVKLVEQTFFDGHLKMLVPEHFVALDDVAIHSRFNSDVASVVVLENVQHTIALTAVLQKSDSAPGASGFKAPKAILLRLVGDGIKNAYAAKQTLRDEIVTRDGHPILFFELAATSHHGESRILCAYTFVGDRPLEVLFTCPEARAAEWAPVGAKMIDSVAIKE